MGFFSKGSSPDASEAKKFNSSPSSSSEGVRTPARASVSASSRANGAGPRRISSSFETSKDEGTGKTWRCGGARLWWHVLTLLQLLTAGAVIAVFAGALEKSTQLPVDPTENYLVTYSVCYATTTSFDICSYAYWVAGLSMLLSVTISAFQYFSPKRLSVCCISLEALLGLLGALWWGAAAIVAIVYADKANAVHLPYGTARTVAWILCWCEAGLFLLSFISSATDCCCCVARRRQARLDQGP